MRLVFAGTPQFARAALARILESGHEVPLVLTQPDRPAGRGMRLTASPVKELAQAAGIAVCQPRSLRLDGKHPDDARAAQAALLRAEADVMVVAAYGLILPKWVLTMPVRGCVNIHASLLPRWRGAAPIQRAIEAGDATTGITIMQMDEGLDTGDMLHKVTLPIQSDHTAASLHDDLAVAGAQAISDALDAMAHGGLTATPQDDSHATYADKLSRAEAELDLTLPAVVLERRIRAFNPFPGATLSLPGISEPVKVWQARVIEHEGPHAAGTLIRADASGIDMATSQGALRLLELQKPGGRRQPVSAFVQGWSP